MDVPNAMDGVAGVTQDAVPVGGEFTYRFVAERAAATGTTPTRWPTRRCAAGCSARSSSRPGRSPAVRVDVLAMAHTYGGVRTVNGAAGDLRVPAEPGDSAYGSG